jgi:3-deoxy-D-manno-octulosonate 8-phosphate phosphatase (KDO 8-P phosphatase)
MKNLKEIQYIVIDVDGTMTDAGIYYDENGNELKKFCTRDAAGFFAAGKAGIKTMVLTGRECQATVRRMQEMKVDHIVQNIKDKKSYLTEFMKENGITKEQIAYIGDDLNDYPGMILCNFVGCPADACEEIKEFADYVSTVKGGFGAVRDVIFFLLKERGEWKQAISEVYGIGI